MKLCFIFLVGLGLTKEPKNPDLAFPTQEEIRAKLKYEPVVLEDVDYKKFYQKSSLHVYPGKY